MKSEPTPLQLAETLRHQRGFVWLDSLSPHSAVPRAPQEQGCSLLAAEPDLILEGKLQDCPQLEKELQNRIKSASQKNQSSGAAIGYVRYDGSFCFGFYETVHRFFHTEKYVSTAARTPHTDDIELTVSPDFFSDITKEEFCKQIALAQDEIAAGNIYQVCLAHRFQAQNKVEPWPFYLRLRKSSPAPFAAYLNLGKEIILSSSPECFLNMEGRHITTRPIKGTRPRGKTAEEDARLSHELQHSSKENAELVMITDLLRNDLSQICDYGTVRTPQLLMLETYPQVFHLVSTVEGRLRKNISHPEALRACFPGGSISGAPKKKAMELIARFESAPRGVFTGSIGYFGFDGKSEFNIAIRTVTLDDAKAEFHVGAGITCDSIPEEEWEETLHKAAGILAAAGQKTSPDFLKNPGQSKQCCNTF